MSSNNNNTPMASCTGRILVVKDGKDGVGIKSADVIFAVYVSDTAAPADDYGGWKTMYDKLIFAQGSFIWTATKITDTNNKSWLTGKRCLGKCEDFADIKELYALGDSNQQAPNDGWKETYSPVKGKWLWTKNEITLQGVAGKVYTDPVCAGYFPNDGINGTNFNPKGIAKARYENFTKLKSSGKQWEVWDIILLDSSSDYSEIYDDDAHTGYSTPSVITYTNAPDYTWNVIAAEVGDGYNVNGYLYVNNGDEWVNFGDIQGPQGESGENAPWVLLSENPIVFESNDKGQVESATKMTDINVMCGTEIVTSQCTFAFKESSSTHFNKDKAFITSNGGETETITINSEGLGTKKIGDYDIPYPNSSVTMTVTFGDYIFDVTINIIVDTSLVDGYFRTSIKGLEAQYTEMNTTVEGNTALLSVHQSRIEANANAIKTKVSQTDYNDNNDAVDKRFSSVEQNARSIKQSVEAIDASGKATKAELEACVEKQEDGSYASKMKVYADNISISAGHVLNIQGNYLIINTSNFKLDENGNVSLTGEINATKGTIGGFDINNSSIGTKNVSSDRSVDGMLLTSEQIVFNNNGRQAIVGAFADGGTKLLGSFYDNNFELIPKYGVRFGIGGSMSKNVAIPILGGCIEGLAIGTLVSVDEEIISSTIPGNKKITLDRNVGAAIISTGYKYKKSSSVKDFETRSRDVEVSLPDMHKYDDGHIIRIKRLPNDNSNIYVHAKGCYRLNTDGTETFEDTIIIDTNCIEETTMTMGHEGFAMTLIFFYDLITVKNGKTYKGAWVEWKNPRYWS